MCVCVTITYVTTLITQAEMEWNARKLKCTYIVTVNNIISDDDEQKDLIQNNNDDLSTTILIIKITY